MLSVEETEDLPCGCDRLASEPACIEELSLLAFVHFALLLMLVALPIPSGPQELALPEKEKQKNLSDLCCIFMLY